MKIFNIPMVMYRGLFGALCIVTMVVSNCKIVYADSTTDDLKAFLGFTVEKHDEVERYESNYDKLMSNTSEIEADVHIEKEVELSAIDILNQNIGVYGIELSQMVRLDASPYDARLKLDSIIEAKEEIKQLGYSTSNSGLIDDDKDYSYQQLVVYESKDDINSRWYNIGDIGNDLKFPLDSTRIIRPYGFEVEYNDEKEKYVAIGQKNPSLWLDADVGDTVKAQYNGVILSIEEDKEGQNSQSIAIKHGNNVYTIYKHVIVKDNIKVGDHVSQYDIIGTAAKSLEEGYDNHIEIELIVDKMYINPLLMYGTSGKGLYEAMLRSSNKEYAVEKGEGYYWNSNMQQVNPNNKSN